jgi:DNA-binding beta-propeller fold protein YncE
MAVGLAPAAAAEKKAKPKPKPVHSSTPVAKAELLCELPEAWNTPDGMTLLPSGDVILCVPNFNDMKSPPVLVKIKPDNSTELFYNLPPHPETGRAGPLGIAVAPDGNLYYADCQVFHNKEKDKGLLFGQSRLVKIVVKDGKAVEAVPVVTGFNAANAVVVRDGYVYVTETILEPNSKPLVSGVVRVKMDEFPVKLTGKDDPHVIATLKTYNEKIPFGADGAAFDSRGNLYVGNFADGTLHKITFDKEGKVRNNTIFAKVPFLKCCDGIFYDKKTNKIYIADSIANAVQMVSMDGSVQTLAQDEDNDGSGGRLDQPCEVLVRGDEVLVSNMDFPMEVGVNKKYDKPYTMSVIKLKK